MLCQNTYITAIFFKKVHGLSLGFPSGDITTSLSLWQGKSDKQPCKICTYLQQLNKCASSFFRHQSTSGLTFRFPWHPGTFYWQTTKVALGRHLGMTANISSRYLGITTFLPTDSSSLMTDSNNDGEFSLLYADSALWDPTTSAMWGSLNFCPKSHSSKCIPSHRGSELLFPRRAPREM